METIKKIVTEEEISRLDKVLKEIYSVEYATNYSVP